MASIEHHHTFTMVPRHMSEEHEQYGESIYPAPPQGAFSAGIDLGLNSEAYDPRFLSVTMGGYDHNPFALDGPAAWAYGDAELRAHLSPGSENSPTSSAVGSPRSTHDQPAPLPEWAPHSMSPAIVDSQGYYAAGTEYSFAPGGMEELAPFAFAAEASKPPGFVGELPQTFTTSASGQQPQHTNLGSPSPSVSRRESTCSVFSEAGPAAASPCEPAYGQIMSSPMSPLSSRKFSVFTPSDSSKSLSSPTAPVWTSPTVRHASPFFSQSSGHFIAPLGSSCWFP